MEIPKKMAFDQNNDPFTKVQSYFTKKSMRAKAMHAISKCRIGIDDKSVALEMHV